MTDETVPGARQALLSDGEGAALRRKVDALAESVAAIEHVREGEPWRPAVADYGFGVLHQSLAELIVSVAWNVGGTWAGRFSPVVLAAMRLTDIEERSGSTDGAELRAAEHDLEQELQGCPGVSEDCVRSIEWAVRSLAELELADLPEAGRARAALHGAMCVGQAYAAGEPGDDAHHHLHAAFQRIGRRGAEVRHTKTRALKAWALAQAATMKGADKAVARELAKVLPVEFAEASDDPERLIYDALLARKARLPTSRNG